MATAVDIAVNPADSTQQAILYSNGRIYLRGFVFDTAEYEEWRQALYESHGKNQYFDRHFTRIQVTSWSPFGGYVLREWGVGQGIVKEFGNAQVPGALGATTDPHPYTTTARYGQNIMRAMAMDPAGNGNGYIMSRFGRIYRIGIPTALTTNNFPAPQGEMIDMALDYSTRKTVLLDQQGRLFMGNGSVYGGTSEKDSDTYLGSSSPLGKWQATYWHMFRRVVVVDWTTVATKPKGYALDSRGYIHRFNTPELPLIKYVWKDRNVATALVKLSYPTPFAYMVLAYDGSTREVLSSTAPTVVITNPGTITTTTRPAVEWDIVDKEFDAEDYTEVHWFHAGGFTPGTTVPAEKVMLRGSIQHSLQPVLPLPNGTVGVAIRTTEMAQPGKSGLVSAWDSETWTQNVTRPGAPTVAVVAANSPPRATVTVTAATGAAENGRIADLEYTDVQLDATAGMVLPSAAAQGAWTADKASLDITNDIELWAEVTAPDYTPALEQTLVGKWAAGSNSYLFVFQPDGKLILYVNSAGDVISGATSSVPIPLANGTRAWFGVTRRVSDGRVQFFYSRDAHHSTGRVQIGTDQNNAVPFKNSTAPVEVGAHNNGADWRLAGTVHRAEVINGIGGTVVASPNFGEEVSGTTSFYDAQANIWALQSGLTYITSNRKHTDWQRVRSADGLPLYAGAGVKVYTDREIPAGVARKYRARTVINDADNYNNSLYSMVNETVSTASISPLAWWLSTPEALSAEVAALEVAIYVQPGAQIEHEQRISAALPLDGSYGRGAIVTRTRPRAKTFDLSCWVLTEPEYITLMKILDDGRVMCIRDVLGRSTFVQLRANPVEEPLRAGPDFATPWNMKHAHSFRLPLVEVRRPAVPDRLVI